MNLNPIYFIRKSVFIKILLIILGLGFLINILVFGFFKTFFEKHVEEVLHDNFKNYFEYVANDIGSPPDTVLAKQISDKYSLAIWYKSDSLNWSSADSSSYARYHRLFKRYDHAKEEFSRDSTFIVRNSDGSQFIFWGDFRKNARPGHNFLVHLLIVLSVLITLAYFLVRWIFKPVKLLSKSVEEVSSGNLDNPIIVKNKDELGRLANSFNSMTERIKDMLKSRDQLLLDVSHELRSPLTRMKMALEFLEDGEKKTSIENDIKEIELMITEILETERLKAGYGKLKLEKSDISELIKELLKDYKGSVPNIVIKGNLRQILLSLDKERIKIVLRNIIENALRYSNSESEPIEVAVDEYDKRVDVIIKDDGMGIPENDIPNLFEPFYRVDSSRSKKTGGYGLGLSLCKKIMDAHRGSILIKNNDGKGITVYLGFPKE